jgi:hypothetical protein
MGAKPHGLAPTHPTLALSLDSWRALLAPFVRVQHLVHPTVTMRPSSVRYSPSRRTNGPGAPYRV